MRNRRRSHVAAAGLLLCSGAALAHTGANSAHHPRPWRRGLPNASVSPLRHAQVEAAALHGNPASELAPNAPQRYTIRRGDTLWRIAGQYEPPRLFRRLQLLRGWSLRKSRGGSLGPIDAATLKRAHALVETGASIGKVVLEGFG